MLPLPYTSIRDPALAGTTLVGGGAAPLPLRSLPLVLPDRLDPDPCPGVGGFLPYGLSA